jgi:hypothetical protein
MHNCNRSMRGKFMKNKQTQKPEALVGQYFHSIEDNGTLKWQGVVIGNPEPGWYLLQLFEWLAGEPNVRRLIRIEALGNWLFYQSGEAMVHSYEYGAARQYRAEYKISPTGAGTQNKQNQ